MNNANNENLNVSKISHSDENFEFDQCSNINSSATKNKSKEESNDDTAHIKETTKETENVIKRNSLDYNKAKSYQDIHSEYTKRRYRNVESKVAKYVANMKAQDSTRRNSRKSLSQGALTQPNNEHHPNKTDTVLSTPTTDDTTSYSRDSSSDGFVYIEKHVYEQLLKYKETHDYLEIRLDEKHADNCRLKKNLDLLRIELLQCKDKLKQNRKNPMQFNASQTSSVDILSKCAVQTFLYPFEKVNKIIQTDITLTPSPLPSTRVIEKNVLPTLTPLTPESHNTSLDYNILGVQAPIKVNKITTAIQPLSLNFSTICENDTSRDYNDNTTNTTLKFLRHRTNSLASRKKLTPVLTNVSLIENSNNNISEIQDDVTPTSPTPTSTPTTINPTTELTTNKSKKRCLRKRIKRFFIFCTTCKEIDDTVNTQQQSYTQIPLLEKSLVNYCQNNDNNKNSNNNNNTL